MVDKDKLQSIIKHPDFSVVEDIIKDYIEPMLKMNNIDLTQDAGTIKGEIQARLKICEQLNKLLTNLGIFRKQIDQVKPNYK